MFLAHALHSMFITIPAENKYKLNFSITKKNICTYELAVEIVQQPKGLNNHLYFHTDSNTPGNLENSDSI